MKNAINLNKRTLYYNFKIIYDINDKIQFYDQKNRKHTIKNTINKQPTS